MAWHIRDETYSKTLAEFVLHIESALQRTGAKELPSLLMGTVIVLAGAESAAQINARYGTDPSVTFYTHIFGLFRPFSPQGDQRNVRDATHAK